MTDLPNTKQIPLTQGKFSIVDESDYEWLMDRKWCFHGRYAKSGKSPVIYMHRLIIGAQNGMDTDHINGNRLDNRRCNLRIVSRSQNNMNRRKLSGTSKYKGVYFDKRRNKWVSQIGINNEKKWLGDFRDEWEAALAYNLAAVQYFGRFALVNPVPTIDY